jgi:hypothetical protein
MACYFSIFAVTNYPNSVASTMNLFSASQKSEVSLNGLQARSRRLFLASLSLHSLRLVPLSLGCLTPISACTRELRTNEYVSGRDVESLANHLGYKLSGGSKWWCLVRVKGKLQKLAFWWLSPALYLLHPLIFFSIVN